jgi:hypothetical protein
MSKASEAKSVFMALDTNGDGELDPQELQCRLSDFGVEVRGHSSVCPTAGGGLSPTALLRRADPSRSVTVD